MVAKRFPTFIRHLIGRQWFAADKFFSVVMYPAFSKARIWVAKLPSVRPNNSFSSLKLSVSLTIREDIIPSRALLSNALLKFFKITEIIDAYIIYLKVLVHTVHTLPTHKLYAAPQIRKPIK